MAGRGVFLKTAGFGAGDGHVADRRRPDGVARFGNSVTGAGEAGVDDFDAVEPRLTKRAAVHGSELDGVEGAVGDADILEAQPRQVEPVGERADGAVAVARPRDSDVPVCRRPAKAGLARERRAGEQPGPV